MMIYKVDYYKVQSADNIDSDYALMQCRLQVKKIWKNHMRFRQVKKNVIFEFSLQMKLNN